MPILSALIAAAGSVSNRRLAKDLCALIALGLFVTAVVGLSAIGSALVIELRQ